MDELFRFVAVRAPEWTDSGGCHLAQPNSPLQKGVTAATRRKLANSVRGSKRTELLEQIIEQIIENQPGAIELDPSKLASYAALDRIATWATDAAVTGRTLAKAQAECATAFNVQENALSGVVASGSEFERDRATIADTIVAVYVTPTLGGSLAQLGRLYCASDLVVRIASGDKDLADDAAFSDAMTGALVLPEGLFPPSPVPVHPVGVGDLIVVRQHILRYEKGEISHVENVLASETRGRSTKHVLTTEATTTLETETTTETESDLETTERAEFQQEISNVQKEESQFKAGLTVSSKYGDTRIDAKTDVAYQDSKDSSTKSSSDYSKSITKRAVSKVTERVRQQFSRRVTETFEEDNEHGFTNTTQGAGNITGVYQWLNKVYRTRMFNYGKRLMFDVVVPEPAAFLIAASTANPPAKPTPPPELNIAPDQIVRSRDESDGPWPPSWPNILAQVAAGRNPALLVGNPRPRRIFYGDLLKAFNVSAALDAYPEDVEVVSASYASNNGDPAASEIDIPAGYAVDSQSNDAIVVTTWDNWGEGGGTFSGPIVYVGGAVFDTHDRPAPGQISRNSILQKMRQTSKGNGETAKLAWSVSNAGGTKNYNVTIDVKCVLLPDALAKWQQSVHAAVVAARQKMLTDYNDELARAAFSPDGAQPDLGSQNPDQNRLIERRELKREALRLFTAGGIPLVKSMVDETVKVGPDGGVPAEFPALPEAIDEGSYLRFFEQAFEWEHMTYLLYPYVWARKERWPTDALRTSNDPAFADFLNAGAARVVVPVRPGFENDVGYYLVTGKVWMGRDLPVIGDADYLPIADEIRSAQDAEYEPVPVGAPWDDVVPTDLVYLRGDSQTPEWKLTDPWQWDAVN
jgi:hypothetical protein